MLAFDVAIINGMAMIGASILPSPATTAIMLKGLPESAPHSVTMYANLTVKENTCN